MNSSPQLVKSEGREGKDEILLSQYQFEKEACKKVCGPKEGPRCLRCCRMITILRWKERMDDVKMKNGNMVKLIQR